jgi:hypothetical protein
MASSANRKGIEIPNELHASLNRFAQQEGLQLAHVAAIAIWEHLQHHAATDLKTPWNGETTPASAWKQLDRAKTRIGNYRRLTEHLNTLAARRGADGQAVARARDVLLRQQQSLRNHYDNALRSLYAAEETAVYNAGAGDCTAVSPEP